MNTTEAICGHRVPACGEPGSAMRRRDELRPCSDCLLGESAGQWLLWFERAADRVRELEDREAELLHLTRTLSERNGQLSQLLTRYANGEGKAA